jgi:RNA-binding protein YlmH
MNKQALLKSITQPEERLLFSKALDRLSLCSEHGETAFTDFLDPMRTAGFMELLKRADARDVIIQPYGGAEGCERKMLGFTPDYAELNTDDFPIDAVTVNFNAKFSRAPGHRDYLGSILGLGIDRGKVGDIALGEDSAMVFIHSDISDYVCVNLEKVGNTKVKAEKLGSSGAAINQNGSQMSFTLPSLRLDALVGAAFHLSRSKASELIAAERVFVNWLPTADTSKQVKQDDVVTARGLGRVKLVEVTGKTKKNRIAVKVMKY